MKRLTILLAVGSLVFAGAAAAYAIGTITLAPGKCVAIGKQRVCARPAPTVTVAETTVTEPVTVTAPPPPPKTAFSDGTYRVGTNIQAGTYQASSGGDCYWVRLRGFSGAFGDIIANSFARATIVTIDPGDVGFESKNCGNWTRVG